ncbi:MAG: hypothetical protein GY906_04665 [bacterium]|nr:hypothetical protein [bacterium]
MARIQLRDTKIYLQDGLAGTCDVNDAAGIAVSDTTVTIDGTALNTTVVDQVPLGARFTAGDDTIHTVTARTPASGTTTELTFTPAATAILADDGEITFLPNRLTIKIGEGDLAWSESREFIYDLDRDELDTVRQGADQPMSVDLAFTFEYVTAETDNPPSPVDALKKQGEASEWVSSSSDLCEPYALDVVVEHCLACGTDQDQDILLPDFRYESLDFSIQDASISVSGQCNATEATSTRADFDCDDTPSW